MAVTNVSYDTLPQAVSYLIEKVEKLENLLETQKSETTVPDNPNQRMNLKELQAYLPDHPAAPTVYGWVRNNLIPFYKKGKKLSFKKSEIDAWLDAGRNKTDEEIAEEANEYINRRRIGKWVPLSTSQRLSSR